MICDGWGSARALAETKKIKSAVDRSPKKGRDGEGAIASTRGACAPLSQRARPGVLFDLDCSVFDTEDPM
jgi:hypothetical protein